MAIKNYREIYVKVILSHGTKIKVKKTYLAKLNFMEIKNLADKLQS